MKQTINVYQFRNAFTNYNRESNFSWDGLGALFDYLEELEDSTGQEYELDVIALCCEYSEYENLEEFQGAYSTDYESIEDIERKTTVIRIDDDSFIIQDF